MTASKPHAGINIAVIGTGNMGAPMAINLAKSDFTVSVFDIDPVKMAPLQEHTIRICRDHGDAIRDAHIVLTMLPTGKEVADVMLNQVIGQASPDALLIDSSTIDLSTAQQIHASARSAGHAMLDAPVSGGTGGAQNGALTFMLGGSNEAVQAALPALEAMGRKIIHCGEGGMGQAAKMCNNMMLGIQMASVAEGFRLAERVGLSLETLYDVSSNSSGNCFSLTAFNPVPGLLPDTPSSRNFQPGFSTDLMLKDMKLALQAATAGNLPLDVAPVASALYETFSQSGNGGLDFSAIIKLHDRDDE